LCIAVERHELHEVDKEKKTINKAINFNHQNNLTMLQRSSIKRPLFIFTRVELMMTLTLHSKKNTSPRNNTVS